MVKTKKKSRARRNIGRGFAIFGITLGMLVVFLYCVMFVLAKGPSIQARNIFVLSVRETSIGGFLANLYFSKDEIAQIEAQNKVSYVEQEIDSSLITIDKDKIEQNSKLDFTDKEKEDGVIYGEGLEIHPVNGPTYSGFMVVVYDPSRVMVGVSSDKYDGSPGLEIEDMCKKYNGVLAVNGGGFLDHGGVGNGGEPVGIVISEGKLRNGDMNKTYEVIGIDNNNILIVGNMTPKQALNKGVRDALCWGPILIVNGIPANVSGRGGGLNPRTAIGQRSDGAILLLVIDGRQTHSLGASMNDLIKVFLDYDAVNAGNLDGGGSTILYYDGKVLNNPSSVYGSRALPDGIVVR